MTRALPSDTWFCSPDPETGETPWKCIETTPIEAARRARAVAAPASPAAVSEVREPAVSRPEADSPTLESGAEPNPGDAASPGDSLTGPVTAPRVRIADLPPGYYTIQLVAFSDRERLQTFAEAHDLWGLTAARVRNGQRLYYVLLWGVYESYDQALEYLDKLPASLDRDKVWVRPLGSLQAAMRAADEFTGTPQ